MSVGKNIPHDSARGHVTGQSVFIDDRPPMHNEVFVLPVGVPAASGILKNIFAQKALAVPGVLGCFSAQDLVHNKWGSIVSDQPILVDRNIGYHQEPVALLVGQNTDCLLKARSLIEFEIEPKPAIFSIDEAIKAKSFLFKARELRRGDPDSAMNKAPHRLEGEFQCGGQEHFYLESQAAIAYPLEDGQLEIHSSTQHPTETQHLVAEALGLRHHQVVCIVKRLGGGFGGKESQAAPFAAMAALVAQKLKRPARIVLNKDDDMMMTGKRHPFKNFYEVGFSEEGRILALKVKLCADGGAYLDLSSSILERAMFHIDNAYFLETALIEGLICRTNFASNTAFRGFGGPQGAMTIESIIEDISEFLKVDALQIRKLNCYNNAPRNITPYGQELHQTPLPHIFEELQKTSQYQERRAEIEKFNTDNPLKRRGLSMTATKFGIAFTARFLNQGSSLVHIHRDGTVQISTGATEMGQGVNTKILQIAADSFGLAPENIKLMPTSTEKNANTSPTAASCGSDINGSATLRACQTLKERLAWLHFNLIGGTEMNDINECPPLDLSQLVLSDFIFCNSLVTHLPSGSMIKWTDLINKAYLNRIQISELAHFKTSGLGFDKKTALGSPFLYFTNGAATTEVEVDLFTGQSKVLRTDILMDLGRSINPGIDRGQVTGAFVQGMGWVTSEKLCYSAEGKLLTHSPTTYKIPSIQDTPLIFNVSFLKNSENNLNVSHSKAVGEPPFLLGISVWTAIKNAISSTRISSNPTSLQSPATPEEILMRLRQ